MKNAFLKLKKHRDAIDDLDCLNPEDVFPMFGISSDLEREQLMALVALIKSDIWMENPLLFEDMVLILNGISPSPLSFESVTCKQIYYALYVMKHFRPDLDLSELVKAYIEFEFSEEGFLVFPKESGMETPIKEYLHTILEMTSKSSFSAENILENQASKLYESLAYTSRKREEDGI
jgi:hypothetical protein